MFVINRSVTQFCLLKDGIKNPKTILKHIIQFDEINRIFAQFNK